MAWVAAQSLSSVDRLLARPHPVASEVFKTLGRADARLLLLYQVAEQNRRSFETWEAAQIITGVVFFLFLLLATREKKFALGMVLLMIAVVLVQRFLLTPEMISLGRVTDFVPPDAHSPERTRLGVLDSGYWVLELVKLVVGLVLAARLISRRNRRSADARQEFNVVDKANHRHVNGL